MQAAKTVNPPIIGIYIFKVIHALLNWQDRRSLATPH
jgi:hypothetical protein